MKKATKQIRKLNLTKETLTTLNSEELKGIVGGSTVIGSTYTGITTSYA